MRASPLPAAALLLAIAWASAPAVLGAQVASATRAAGRIVPALRADAFAAREWTAHVGGGAEARAGTYLRLGLSGGAGVSGGRGARPGPRASGRVEATGRFLLDPFRERRHGPYVGGGVALRLDESRSPEVRLTAMVGVEGGVHRGWSPAVELGFGGGARAGLVWRRARARAR